MVPKDYSKDSGVYLPPFPKEKVLEREKKVANFDFRVEEEKRKLSSWKIALIAVIIISIFFGAFYDIYTIAYGEKGEKHHLILKESDFNYKDLLKALKDFKCEGVLISESPNIEQDAMLMQETYNA